MIKELPYHETELACKNEPLLEYVCEVSNHFWLSYDPDEVIMMDDGTIRQGEVEDSLVPFQFVQRYNKGSIDISRINKYEDSVEVQETLKAFHLDPSKFWYLCLCIKDYVDGQTIDTFKRSPSHRKIFKDLFDEMKKMTPNKGAELSFRVDGSKHPVKIADHDILFFLKDLVEAYLKMSPESNDEFLDSGHIDSHHALNVAPIYRIYLFDHYLGWFLQDLKADKSVMSANPNELISYDKKLLISRMIFILGISDDESYYEEYDENGRKNSFLKNNLRKYKDITIPTVNKHYFL